MKSNPCQRHRPRADHARGRVAARGRGAARAGAGARRVAPTGGPVFAGTVRGLKAALPVKACAACGRPMAWRRAWARSWDEVRYCSETCRRQRHDAAGPPGEGR